jgi:hypothetical protein
VAYDEDLSPFENDPVFQALTGPAAPGELAGEAAALAAFRTANGAKPHRRFAARIGTGGGIVIAAIALSGGVAAAAYSNALPSGVQHFVHIATDWLPVPTVPAPPSDHKSSHTTADSGSGAGSSVPTGGKPSGGPTGAPAPAGSTTPSPSPTGSPKVHGRTTPSPGTTTLPTTTPTPTTSTPPTTSPTPTPTPTDTSTPTPTPTPSVSVPAALSISVSQTRVPANAGVEVIGALTDATGQPVAGHLVSVYEGLSGDGGTELLSTAESGADGSVDFQVPGLTQDVRLTLRAGGGVRSAAVRVVVVPILSAAVTQGSPQDAVSISAQGVQPGDAMSIYQHTAGGWTLVDSLTFDGSGMASFDAVPDPNKTVRYRAVLATTPQHSNAAVLFVTPPSGVKK